MKLLNALHATLRSRRFWLWQIGGAIIYSIPVSIRFLTQNVRIPFLDFPGFWIDHFIPGNLVEKILVNAFFPGGAGGVSAEVLLNHYNTKEIRGKKKYIVRLTGALFQTTAWSLFQYWGYSLMIIGPYGGNIFEHPIVFPINFILASLSIFTPTLLEIAKSKIKLIQKAKV